MVAPATTVMPNHDQVLSAGQRLFDLAPVWTGPSMSSDNIRLYLPQPQIATILFTDIVSFSDLMKRAPFHHVVNRLKQYFYDLSESVNCHGGTVDKFFGDGMMAVFDQPGDAIQAGFDIQRSVAEFNTAQCRRRLPVFETRLAINSGPVVRAEFGSPPTNDSTILGPAVNVAFHLAQEVPPGAVLISQQTYKLLPDGFPVEIRSVTMLEWNDAQWEAIYEVQPG
jgi:class 3 adenylate cyclase